MIRLVILFLAAGFFTSAQTVTWSSDYKENKKATYKKILGATDNGDFYMLSSNISLESDREREGFRNRMYLLALYSSELNQIWEKELHTSYDEGHISDVSMINGKVYVTGFTYNKKSKVSAYYIQPVSSEGKWENVPLLLDSFVTENNDKNVSPFIISSHDQSMIAFGYWPGGKELQTIVMDTNLTVRYRKAIGISNDQLYIRPLNVVLTDRGSVFVLAVSNTPEKRLKLPGDSYFELFGYNLPLDRQVQTQIKSDQYFLTDVGITTDNINNSIVVGGFYSEHSQYSTAGVFYYALTEDSLKETRSLNTPFSPSYLQKFAVDRKDNRELVNFSIDRLFVRKDGGVGIIAESVYQTTRSYYDYYMQSFVSHYYYHYGNIMVISVNPDGRILWSNVITKDQSSVDDDGYYSSYFCAVTGGRLAAVYNKYVEDVSSVLITYINPDGAQKTDVLFNELERVTIVPRSARQIDDQTILLPAYKESKFRIAKIIF